MGITVIPSAALPGNAAAGNTPTGSQAIDPAAIDFASLLAGQLGEFGQMLDALDRRATTQNPLDLQAASGGNRVETPLLGAISDEVNEDATPLAAMSVFDMLAPRSAAREAAARDDLAARAETAGSKLIGISIANDKAAAAATNPALLASRISASDALTGNTDTANLAGKPEITTPLTFNPAAGSERTLASGRGEVQHHIPAPINDPRWAQQFGERVVWLARGDVQNAQINISPAQLGPIQINISLNGDQMTAHFVAAHQEVRQALEDAMPRLREMLSGAGINLGQSNVGSQTQQQQQAQQESAQQTASAPRFDGEDAILSPDQQTHSAKSGLPTQHGRGLVDLFA
jgi:flagellar hook-length control protein FliK